MDSGGDWASLALSVARSLIQDRPPLRRKALDLVLQASAGEGGGWRGGGRSLIQEGGGH